MQLRPGRPGGGERGLRRGGEVAGGGAPLLLRCCRSEKVVPSGVTRSGGSSSPAAAAAATGVLHFSRRGDRDSSGPRHLGSSSSGRQRPRRRGQRARGFLRADDPLRVGAPVGPADLDAGVGQDRGRRRPGAMDPLVRQAGERGEPRSDVAPVRVVAAGLALEVEQVAEGEAVGESSGDVLNLFVKDFFLKKVSFFFSFSLEGEKKLSFSLPATRERSTPGPRRVRRPRSA